jgi:hypothetical protein
MAHMENIPPNDSSRRRSLAPACLLIVLILLAIIAVIVIVGVRLAQSVTAALPQLGLPVDIGSVPGDPSHFDPIAAYDTVHKFAGADRALASIVIRYVRADGTLDLKAGYDPNVQYKFFTELATPPPNAPPLGSRGVTDQKWDDQVEVLIQPTRMISDEGDVQGLKPIAAPTCSLRTLWSAAIEKGAPKDAVAIVVVDSSGYDFRIDHTKINLSFDTDCTLKRGS